MNASIAWTPPSELVGLHGLAECGDALYYPGFIDDAADVEHDLAAAIEWREESLLIFGRRVKVPRLCAWYGDVGVAYQYSHTVHRAEPWPRIVGSLRDALHERLAIRFNFVLANLYRDGNDTMGWHSDDEAELGAQPIIASLSLGATRKFVLKARAAGGPKLELPLEHGSLLVMRGDTQKNFRHALPRTKKACGERINLTFRRIYGK